MRSVGARLGVTIGALAALSFGAAVANESLDLGFSEGVEPIRTGGAAPLAARCGRCHTEDHAEWSGSMHRAAHTNAIYQAGLMAESAAFCVNCHSPLPEQAAQITPNLRWYRAHDPRNGIDPKTTFKADEPLGEEGVSCSACHWRGGKVLATSVSGDAPHESVATPALRDGSLCAGCHEFHMPNFVGGELRFGETLMQSTVSEWRAWQGEGGKAACVDCHMPKGKHSFRGAHDQAWLRESVSVRAKRRGSVATFAVESVGVGHHLPSGDLFRNITLEVEEAGAWRTIDRMGRAFSVTLNEETGDATKEVSTDTSLRPGVPRESTANVPKGTRWRLRFHYGAEHDELRGLVPIDELVVVLHEGTV